MILLYPEKKHESFSAMNHFYMTRGLKRTLRSLVFLRPIMPVLKKEETENPSLYKSRWKVSKSPLFSPTVINEKSSNRVESFESFMNRRVNIGKLSSSRYLRLDA